MKDIWSQISLIIDYKVSNLIIYQWIRPRPQCSITFKFNDLDNNLKPSYLINKAYLNSTIQMGVTNFFYIKELMVNQP